MFKFRFKFRFKFKFQFNHINNTQINNNAVKEFSLCVSWNTNGWNFDKKDSVELFISMYKPLFLCFQETGNGSGSSSKYPCRVSLKNYKHFFKKANNEIPGKRGLYIGFHNSCQASLENNTYEYIISLYTYNFWNFTKCSIGNVYVPHSGHSLHARAARIEILSWLNSHSSHPSMLVGDFNLPTEKLGNLLSKFSNWKIIPLWGSSIS